MWRSGVWVALGVLCLACSANDGGSSFPSAQGGNTGQGGSGAGGSGQGGAGVGGATGLTTSSKLDLLLVVDNSLGMTDSQKILANSLPSLFTALTGSGSGVTDLHVGVVTTSLGSNGSTACNQPTATPPRPEEYDDKGHLLGTRPRAATAGLSNGFATWTTGADVNSLSSSVQKLVTAAGEFGCGFEQTLESAYRFLADPKPYGSITTAACPDDPNSQCATITGVDSEVLAQRASFLRPDSAVGVVVLSNENDCSTRLGEQEWYAMRTDVTLPSGSSVCKTNPNDPCCYTCGQTPPVGCAADPTCSSTGDPAVDQINLRCFEQKRRFGHDYLYPIERYRNALTNPTLCTSRADLDVTACPDADGTGGPDIVPNPLFSGGTNGRSASLVHVMSIVGVPWQTLSTGGKAGPVEFPVGGALASKFSVIYGDPTASPPVPPSDPLMQESIEPRTGTTPGAGEALAPPSAGYLANSVNGHEYPNPKRDDLQYACLFPLPSPMDCAAVQNMDPRPLCECDTTNANYANNPMCQATDGTYGNTRYFSKAYPGLRHIGLVKELGDRGALGSLCPRNASDTGAPDYGYRPALDAFVRELGITH